MTAQWEPMPDFATWLRDHKGRTIEGHGGDLVIDHIQAIMSAMGEYATAACRNMEDCYPRRRGQEGSTGYTVTIVPAQKVGGDL